ncbi:hypothetical protein OM076_11335 [Solirubrobacter ginsenosidimutans]|uniref:Uncharacterized protein n=1 Tax=Solirubrobacter ginsenosidimutans TaxID=490573 RepID=A0A9X3S026_9ACTN|nr:hypothetical protein [Solirubrobacter ginsenosidimutans]MDA0160859.1 hypothetical protein [Solirubrobacter ginsenosidimutans]
MITVLAALLVPDPASALPEGFTPLRVPLIAGLPQRIALGAAHHAVLVLPTGLARSWVAADPAALVGTSDPDFAPFDPGTPLPGLGARAPLRLVVRAGTDVLGSLPVVAGLRRMCRDDGGAGVLEVCVGAWQLRAGTVLGAGDFGSFVELGWRRADLAARAFGPPPPSRFVLKRTPLIERIESDLGLEWRAPHLARQRAFLRKAQS